MSYFPSYTYSTSAGWTFGVQPGSSSSSNAMDEWSHSDPSSLLPTHYSHFFANAYYHEIPISRDSALAGALGPVDSDSQDDGTQPLSPAPQLAPQPVPQPVLPQLAGPAPPQPFQPIFTQPVQLGYPVNPPLVAPTYLGVRIQNVAPPPASATRRPQYVYGPPPERSPRQPAGTPRFCKVGGCQRWTMDKGKKLGRHRASHFQTQAGVECPNCRELFSRSFLCGKHLKKCNPQLWIDIAATKGTQDSWGIKVGKELITQSLVHNNGYTPEAYNKF